MRSVATEPTTVWTPPFTNPGVGDDGLPSTGPLVGRVSINGIPAELFAITESLKRIELLLERLLEAQDCD